MPYKSITFYVNSSPVSDVSECKYEQMGKNDPDEIRFFLTEVEDTSLQVAC